MTRLFYVAFVVRACSRTPTPAPIDHVAVPRSRESCADGGERLVVHVCRHDDNLAWTITHKTTVALWAFVAPPGFPIGPYVRQGTKDLAFYVDDDNTSCTAGVNHDGPGGTAYACTGTNVTVAR